MSSNLMKTWVLTAGPLACRQSILEEIHIQIKPDRVSVCDSANSSNGTWELINTNADGYSGTIKLTCGGWTERGRIWEDEQLGAEASIVNTFIHSLIRTEFNYELVDGALIVYFEGGKYHFTARP